MIPYAYLKSMILAVYDPLEVIGTQHMADNIDGISVAWMENKVISTTCICASSTPLTRGLEIQ